MGSEDSNSRHCAYTVSSLEPSLQPLTSFLIYRITFPNILGRGQVHNLQTLSPFYTPPPWVLLLASWSDCSCVRREGLPLPASSGSGISTAPERPTDTCYFIEPHISLLCIPSTRGGVTEVSGEGCGSILISFAAVCNRPSRLQRQQAGRAVCRRAGILNIPEADCAGNALIGHLPWVYY